MPLSSKSCNKFRVWHSSAYILVLLDELGVTWKIIYIYIYIYGWHGLIYWGFIFYNQPKNLWDYSLIVVAVGGDRKFEINNWHGLFQQKQHWHGFKYEVLLIANYNPHLEWGFGN